MARVLITGMSGTGKSTLLQALGERGHLVVDTDYNGWTRPDGLWNVRRMARLLLRESRVVVSGTVENQVDFYDQFEHVVLLTAPLPVLLDRLASRTNNPFGRTAEQRAVVERYVITVEPLLRRSATTELDGTASLIDLVAAVETLILAS